MGCGMRKESKSQSVVSENNGKSLENPLRLKQYSLFTVKEEVSDLEQSRIPSKRVSAFTGTEEDKAI
jgi:hypothetical protein